MNLLRLSVLAALLTVAALPVHASESAATIPACPLLAPTEITEAFGTPVVADEQEPMGGETGAGRMTLCLFTPEGGRLGATVALTVWAWPAGHPGAAGQMTASADSPAAAPLSIGDGAVWDGDRLTVRKGDVTFILATSLNALDATPGTQAGLEALARMVVERLP